MEPRVSIEAGVLALARSGVAPAVIAARLGIRRVRIERIIAGRKPVSAKGCRA